MTEKDLFSSRVNVNNLGYFLDGWADLIEGMGDKEDEVRLNVLNGLKERGIQGVDVGGASGFVSITSNESRSHTLAITDPGATTAIYIGKSGKDLYAAWRTFINPVLNKDLIYGALAVAVILGLFTGAFRQTGGGLFGGPTQTTFSLIGWIIAALVIAFLIAGAVAIAGKIWKGNYLWFFFIQPSLFDADDITAMGLAAHKTILRALDTSGIDISKLRLKRDFKGGRRDEMV